MIHPSSFQLHVLPGPDDLAQAAARFVASVADDRAATKGRFTIALSGGSTPLPLYEALSSSPFLERIAWNKWHVFWSDERCVPRDHPDSNYGAAQKALLDRVAIPPARVHRIRGEIAPRQAAGEYERELRELFQQPKPVFDLMLLGIGEDGHTASLVPGTSALREEKRLVTANWAPHLRAWRITFTLPLINAASRVVFLATQASKCGVIKRVLESDPAQPPLPAALVRPASGQVHWFLTAEAAACLSARQRRGVRPYPPGAGGHSPGRQRRQLLRCDYLSSKLF
ncbi:MAG: 6-phosphogluconolactonase [Chloroflexi bacterium]|nr:6-phosphogluconolactonase [Chloroflexota bacterium]